MALAVVLAPAASLVMLVMARRWRRVEVAGRSMWPVLQPGDRLLAIRARRARPGQLVVVEDPREPGRLLVKRVAAVDEAGLTLLGDNPDASTDSRSMGPLPPHVLRARAVYRYWPAGRTGRLR